MIWKRRTLFVYTFPCEYNFILIRICIVKKQNKILRTQVVYNCDDIVYVLKVWRFSVHRILLVPYLCLASFDRSINYRTECSYFSRPEWLCPMSAKPTSRLSRKPNSTGKPSFIGQLCSTGRPKYRMFDTDTLSLTSNTFLYSAIMFYSCLIWQVRMWNKRVW